LDLYTYDNSANFCIKGLATRPTPKFEMTITPGIHLGITGQISNDGEVNATNVNWTIKVTGGIFGRIHKEKTEIITTLPVGKEETMDFGSLFGLGSISIMITAESDEGVFYQTKVDGIQLLIFTKV
jgi:uncharacterized membrane protein